MDQSPRRTLSANSKVRRTGLALSMILLLSGSAVAELVLAAPSGATVVRDPL